MTMHISIIGALWFTTAEGEDMARNAAADHPDGGFATVIVQPQK
ncbi:hypothetical protein ABZ917_37135 [Nonomuraea wenchangensis]